MVAEVFERTAPQDHLAAFQLLEVSLNFFDLGLQRLQLHAEWSELVYQLLSPFLCFG
jgi:hypothetical protein